jgi:UDP-N-acetylmuramoyl-L-alanyl-D-glutamate--2,6-diaminopimelate ligase
MANPRKSAPISTGRSEPVGEILQRLGVAATTLVNDSRKVAPGAVFAAYPGEISDGRDFIAQAVAKHADGVLWDSREFAWDPALTVANAGVVDLRTRIGEIAAHVSGQPASKMQMIGITGTNGKTSVAHWIAQALTRLGKKTAILGTAGNGFPHALTPALNTTPDAIELQQRLAQYLRMGAAACAMEVSSHGIAQGRINGTQFNIAVLTNLTRDHLDYHGDMDSYAATKAQLFAWPGLETVVLNLDDEFGQRLAAEPRTATVAGYGFARGAVIGSKLKLSRNGLQMRVQTDWGRAEIDAPLLGRFNAANMLAVLTTLLVSGVALADAAVATAHSLPPPGRMQTLGGGAQPLVIVDYAHTPDALEKVLATLREITASDADQGRLICVFGCGGNRDRGKRPLMGHAAETADSVWVTSDNPRDEAPLAIIDEIVAGMTRPHRVEADRARSIFEAIGNAHRGDVVVIAGKGHEDYQEIGPERLPFSDAAVAQKALEAWG